MAKRIEVKYKDRITDSRASSVSSILRDEFGAKPLRVVVIEAFNFDADLSDDEIEGLAKDLFCDYIVQEYSYKKPFYEESWRVEVGYKPGVTDNVGTTSHDAVRDALGKDIQIYSSIVYSIAGDLGDSEEELLEKFGKRMANELVQNVFIRKPLEDKFEPYIPKVTINQAIAIEKIKLPNDDAELEAISKNRLLALNVDEMKAIRSHFSKRSVIEARKQLGLDSKITDVELEVLAQTWSEHCKHKIFNAEIDYSEGGENYAIDSVFRTFIKGATDMLKRPYVVSAFKDNGGIMKFNSKYDCAIKVETHNAPSALDPYGGALTGILGVNRDVIGTGMGAMPIANVNMLCFGPLEEKEVPKGLLIPKRIYEGVVSGIKDGGNKSGIPTVNGSFTFENGFTARPLVYCGTVGIMPSEINGRKTSEKNIMSGYLAIMVGGRVGKDGIHGATFSSQQLDSSVPTSVVQIGDPITQKKALDFIIEARDNLLFEAITDNGAGGLSSSIGEMAEMSNGCEIWLEAVPLKYPGLQPWEILLSESQERMSLAVKPEHLDRLHELAKKHDSEITVIGKFTDNGKMHVLYKGETVAYLDLEFLHVPPRLHLKAKWERKGFNEPKLPENTHEQFGDSIKRLLCAPNIGSKEHTIRRYDHEVQGRSVIKPLMGSNSPSDGGVFRLAYDCWDGVVVAHGICPRYVQDSYDMAAMAFDEAVRNALCTGAKFAYLCALDNFSWPDPVQSTRTPDGEYKLAQLVRACMALHDCCLDYGIPIISGKDSMKNDYYGKDGKYSIPPTLLVTIMGKIDDVRNAISSDFKKEGDVVYLLGTTRDELGGSEYYKLFNGVGNRNPTVNREEATAIYRAFSKACELKLVRTAHDLSDGGLAVALAECSFPAQNGVDFDISLMPNNNCNDEALLFSESGGRILVAVEEKNASKFEKIMEGTIFARAGRVRGDKRFMIRRGEKIMINESSVELGEIWNKVRI